MYCEGCVSLPSIVTIAAAVVAILWFLFRKKEIRATPTATVTDNITAASTSVVYEVFLSFCGKDTRYGFTDFLYTYLVGASILTFRDDNELRVGEEISSELTKAIKESKISIPILSKNYASSEWCLLELEQMVECHKNGGQMIYPIFYDVVPSDVRNQRGSYEKAFRQHKKEFDEKTVQRWREALRMVGGLKGLELKKETGGREGELAKKVAEKVLSELKKNYIHVPKNLVGTETHVEKLKGLLKVDSYGVRIVGIHGMGGVGKTTIAKVIYNKLYKHFDGHCFLDNVRENSTPRDRIVNFQSQLISKILNREVLPKFNDFYEGRNRIKDAVRGRKVLIVLDDVDESFQVDMLIGDQSWSWFGAQSRIIITTRDVDVLGAIEMSCKREGLHDVYASYKPDFMDDHNSLQLFSNYAFKRDSPIEGYRRLSKEVVSIAAGLPLVLVVLGSTFSVVKGKDSWEEKLRKLRVIPHKEVLEKLRFSFEALEYEQKQIFLDIACLFIGRDKTIPSYMWDDCRFYPSDGITVLASRSLITVGENNKLIMHDQLRDLGRHIVREEGLIEPGKQSRFWVETDAVNILETRQGTSGVNAIRLPYGLFDGPLVASHFHFVPNLRYLSMAGLDLDGEFKHLLSNLRWLQCTCSGKFTPTNLHLKNLVILNLSNSQFTEDWEGWSQFKMANKLKFLDLSNCSYIRVLPDLSTFASLDILDASFCGRLKTLPSLSNLTKLVYLNLAGCKKLTEIQGLEKLKSLQDLNIEGCSSLERLPNVSNLEKLKVFKAKECHELIEIGGLHRLNSLEYLDLSSCRSLKGVPDLSNLIKLEVLRVPGLEITDFSNLKKLQQLEVFYSKKLIEFQGLDGLQSLEELFIDTCPIKRLPDLSYLKRLKIINIVDCDQLIEIQDLGGLESLEQLHLFCCSSLERLPNLSNLRKLIELYCSRCMKLIEIPGLDRLESLKFLYIRSCPSLERLPDFPNFGMLKVIEVVSCNKLLKVEELGVIESLESLIISSCNKLQEIPDLRSLKNLKTLKIYCLKELTGIYGLEGLTSLEWLDISGCKSIEALPDFSNLEKLTELHASFCVKLTEIRGLEELKSLEILKIDGCEGLKNLPDLPNTKIERDPPFYG